MIFIVLFDSRSKVANDDEQAATCSDRWIDRQTRLKQTAATGVGITVRPRAAYSSQHGKSQTGSVLL